MNHKDVTTTWSEVSIIEDENIPTLNQDQQIIIKHGNIEIILPLSALNYVLEVVKNID